MAGPNQIWSANEEWPGETIFIIGGGPSVEAIDPEILRERRIIALNLSFRKFPFADFLLFGDPRWWTKYLAEAEKIFAGRIVSLADSCKSPRVLRMLRFSPPGLSEERTKLVFRRTVLASGINLAKHLGAKKIILLGADGKKTGDGRSHHHEAYPWPQKPGCWQEQRKDLVTLVEPLKNHGVEVLNASPGSTIDLWPIVNLKDVLDGCPASQVDPQQQVA